MKKYIKCPSVFKNVYIVMNFGGFREMFYYLRQAKEYVKDNGMYKGEPIYQIYKCNLIIDNQKQK